MDNVKIAFFDAKSYDMEFFNRVNEEYNFEIKYFQTRLSPETASLTKGFDTVCVFPNDTVNKEVIDILVSNNIRLVALRCAGYNNVDLKHIYRKIHVVRVPAYSPYAVAEHAAAMILSLNRKIHRAYNRTRDYNFALDGLIGFDMFGKTAAVIGTGKIGKILINILKGFGMRVLAYDLYPDRDYAEKTGFEYTDLDFIYREADIISLNCPLTPQTDYMINQDSIGKMKDGVMIINTGRGRLIDTKTLIQGLKSKKIGSAGLDVYEEESEYFFSDFSNSVIDDDILARLLTFNNVLITSHQGFFTKEALSNIAGTTMKNIKDFFSNGTLENEICYKCCGDVCNKKTTGKCF